MPQNNIDVVVGVKNQTAAGVADINKSLGQLGAKVDKFKPQFQQMAAIGTSAFIGIGAALGGVIKQAANMESLMMGLTSVAGGAEEASKQFERLRDVAKLPGLGLEEAIQGSINLQAAGLSAGQAEKSLKAFGNALAIVGKGKAELSGVILALQQISSKGKISAEEINQLNERLPQIRKAMEAAFGTSDTEKLQQMGIDAEEFISKVTTEFEKLPAVQAGVNIGFENLQDNLKILSVTIGTTFLPYVNEILGRLDPLVEKFTAWAKSNPELVKQLTIVGLAISGMVAAAGLLGIAIGPIIAGFTFLASPIGLAVIAVSAAIIAFVMFKDKLIEFAGYMEEHFGLVTDLKNLWASFTNFWNSVVIPAWQFFIETIWPALKPLLEKMGIIIGVTLIFALKLFIAQIRVVTDVITFFLVVAGRVASELGERWKKWIDGLMNPIKTLTDYFSNLRNVMSDVLSLASKVTGGTGFIGSVATVGKSVVGKRAEGGPVSGGSFLVGEQGPEIFTPRSVGQISKLAAAGGMNLTINISGNTLIDDYAGERIGRQIVDELKRTLRL